MSTVFLELAKLLNNYPELLGGRIISGEEQSAAELNDKLDEGLRKLEDLSNQIGGKSEYE